MKSSSQKYVNKKNNAAKPNDFNFENAKLIKFLHTHQNNSSC
jgi:hypothetical protein